jgi:hypothetical protein
LASDLTISPSASLTVSFPVIINEAVVTGTVMINTAAVTSSETLLPVTGSVLLTVGGNSFYIPIIAKGGP